MLPGNVGDVRGAIQKAIGENSALKSQIEDFMKERIKNLSAEALGSARQINGVNLVVVGGPRFPEVVKKRRIRGAQTKSGTYCLCRRH